MFDSGSCTARSGRMDVQEERSPSVLGSKSTLPFSSWLMLRAARAREKKVSRPRPFTSSSLLLLAAASVILLLHMVPEANSQGLRGGHHKCRPEQEGRYLPVKMPGNMVVHCKCASGILDGCLISGPACDKKLSGCHFVENNVKGGGVCQTVCKGCIDSNGTRVESGVTWRDGSDDPCTKSHCFSGIITRSQVRCPPLHCAQPVRRLGECCPSCPPALHKRGDTGCQRGPEPLSEGETKPDPLDPCNECRCERGGRLTCERRACPVLPCVQSLQRRVRGKCCPVCDRRHEAGSSINGKCFFNGTLWQPGKTFSPDKCTKCKCGPNADVACERQTCPILSCPASEQVPSSQKSCCSTCQSSVLSSTSHAATTKSLPASRPSHCEFDGTRYKDGDSWDSRCTRCTCALGETRCTLKQCPTLHCPSGSKLIGPKKGKCCPECEHRNKGVCTVFGDPHYRTFDGSVFNFQGSCKYLLASDYQNVGGSVASTLKGNGTFSIRITNDNRASMAFSWLRTITVRYHDFKISLLQGSKQEGMKVNVNGERVGLPYINMGAFSVMQDGYRVLLRTNDGIDLLWDGVSFLELSVGPKYRGQLSGLCGNFNGDKHDDFYGLDGSMYPDGQSFGDSNRVGGLRACSVLPRDMPPDYDPQCKETWESRIKSDRYCNAFNSSLFHSCMGYVDPGYYYKACKLDMCECPGDTCHCEVLTAYARECERAGVIILDWREATGCQNMTSFKFANAGEHHHRNDLPSSNETSSALVSILPSPSDDDDRRSSPRPRLPYATLNGGLPGADSAEDDAGRLGEILPGCTLANAKHCKPQRESEGAPSSGRVSKEGRRRRPSSSTALRRRKNKKKAKKEKIRRQKKLERRRNRRKMKRVKKKLMKSHMGRRKRRRLRRRRKTSREDAKKKHQGSLISLLVADELEKRQRQREGKSLRRSEQASTASHSDEEELLLSDREYSELVASARMRLAAKGEDGADSRARTPLPLREEKKNAEKVNYKRRRRRARDPIEE